MSPPIDPQLLALLRCPQTHSTLTVADRGLIDSLNEKVACQQLFNQIGQLVDQPIEGGLVNADRSLLLPIRDEIVILVSDQAIPIDSVLQS